MIQLNLYYNTTNETGEKLKANKVRVSSQNEKILAFFATKKVDFTPCEVWIAFGQQWPLTSVRRAISSMTEKGFLVKTENKRKGFFGEMNYTWIIKL